MTDPDRAPRSLQPVDELTVHVIVDNLMDILSTVQPGVTPPTVNLLRAGATKVSGHALCCPHWGLSLLVTARRGETTHALLFDTGPEGDSFVRNVGRLGLDLGAVEAIVLSHGHWDHGGGLLEAIARVRAENGGTPVPVFVNDGMLVTRGLRLPNGQVVPFEDVPGVTALSDHGADVVRSGEPTVLLDGMFHLSGQIPRVTPFEQGLPGHVRWSDQANDWEPDPLIMDERYLAVHVRDRGLVVLSACSHAGIVNVLTDARGRFAPTPVHAVVGGLHLSGEGPEKIIPETVAGLRDVAPSRIVAAHCTGWRAFHRLVDAFGEDVVLPSSVGATFAF